MRSKKPKAFTAGDMRRARNVVKLAKMIEREFHPETRCTQKDDNSVVIGKVFNKGLIGRKKSSSLYRSIRSLEKILDSV